MKLLFKTAYAELLKADIVKLVEEGELSTWSIITSEKVKYLKHTQQWGKKGVILLTIDNKKGYLIAEVLKFSEIIDELKDITLVGFARSFSLIFLEGLRQSKKNRQVLFDMFHRCMSNYLIKVDFQSTLIKCYFSIPLFYKFSHTLRR